MKPSKTNAKVQTCQTIKWLKSCKKRLTIFLILAVACRLLILIICLCIVMLLVGVIVLVGIVMLLIALVIVLLAGLIIQLGAIWLGAVVRGVLRIRFSRRCLGGIRIRLGWWGRSLLLDCKKKAQAVDVLVAQWTQVLIGNGVSAGCCFSDRETEEVDYLCADRSHLGQFSTLTRCTR